MGWISREITQLKDKLFLIFVLSRPRGGCREDPGDEVASFPGHLKMRRAWVKGGTIGFLISFNNMKVM